MSQPTPAESMQPFDEYAADLARPSLEQVADEEAAGNDRSVWPYVVEGDEREALRAEVARLREHSVFANHISWRIAVAVGDVPDGADRIEGDPDEQLDRLIAQRDTFQAEVGRWQAHADALNAARHSAEASLRRSQPAPRTVSAAAAWAAVDAIFSWQAHTGADDTATLRQILLRMEADQ